MSICRIGPENEKKYLQASAAHIKLRDQPRAPLSIPRPSQYDASVGGRLRVLVGEIIFLAKLFHRKMTQKCARFDYHDYSILTVGSAHIDDYYDP